MEDLFAESEVTSDNDKKISIGKYADQDSEEEWRALGTFEKGSWNDFKKELLDNYPEAAAAERGTPARLRQVCKEANGIVLGDLDALYAYRRAFLAEAKKLTRNPAVMSNRELVELFISGLSVPMANTLLQYLGSARRPEDESKEASQSSTGGDGVQRIEDRYKLEDVCKAAIQVSINAQGMLQLAGKWTKSERREMTMVQSSSGEDTSVLNKLELLEETQAREKDRLTVVNKQLESKLESIEELIKSLVTSQGRGTSNYVQNFSSGNRENMGTIPGKGGPSQGDNQQRWGRNRAMECFGCGSLEHFQDKCEKVKHHLRIGNLKFNGEKKICLADGERVPNIPYGASLIERMERYYENKPSQAFYGSFEEVEERAGGSLYTYGEYTGKAVDGREQQLAQLEKELNLKEKESLLRAKQLKLESEARAEEKSKARASHVLEMLGQLADDDLVQLKENKSGFH
jgi:hypothetical protein